MNNYSILKLRHHLRAAFIALTLLLALLPFDAPPALAVSPNIVISQVYGGGGNPGAILTSDFIELINRGSSAVNVAGWSIQYTSSTGSSWQKTDLSGVIQPGGYYLIQESTGAGGALDLPTPDAAGAIALSATSGKVALLNNQTLLICGVTTNNCFPNAAIVDFVGYGSSANNYEGSGPAPTLSNTKAALRAGAGCNDTDDNNADFSADDPNPQNSASPQATCGGVPVPTDPTGVGAATPASVFPGNQALLTVAVTPGANPTSTGLTVNADLTPIGGSATQPFFDDGTSGDVTAGDNTFSYQATVAASTAPGGKTINATISDAQARTGVASIGLTVPETTTAIHAIQGAGHLSPLVGQLVGTKGIVIAKKSNGFWIQDLNPDTDLATSEGVFVFTSAAPAVAVGDLVDVTGTVKEYRPGGSSTDNLTVTELDNPGLSVNVLTSGYPLPTATVNVLTSGNVLIGSLGGWTIGLSGAMLTLFLSLLAQKQLLAAPAEAGAIDAEIS